MTDLLGLTEHPSQERVDVRVAAGLAAECDNRGGGVAEDAAVVEGDAAAGEGSHFGVVGDHDDGVALGVEAAEEVGDDALVGGVEVAGGLVGEDDGGLVDEGAGDADALLLAAGEL